MRALEVILMAIIVAVVATLLISGYTKTKECNAAGGVLMRGAYGVECLKVERAR